MEALIFASGVLCGLLAGIVLVIVLVPSYKATERIRGAIDELNPRKPQILQVEDLETFEEKRERIAKDFDAVI